MTSPDRPRPRWTFWGVFLLLVGVATIAGGVVVYRESDPETPIEVRIVVMLSFVFIGAMFALIGHALGRRE